MTADKSNRRFRPKRSLIGPITTAPITAPIKTAAVIHPSIQAQELTCQLSFSIKSSAPDMTPVSYPNNKPPKAPKKIDESGRKFSHNSNSLIFICKSSCLFYYPTNDTAFHTYFLVILDILNGNVAHNKAKTTLM